MANPVARTYSFLDTLAALAGPGGAVNIGSGAGVASEGITCAPTTDIDAMVVGADGSAMHSLVADKSGKVTVRLLKTSPTNELLSTMMAFQRTSGANHGQNVLTVTNKVSGDVVSCQQVAFAKVPTVVYDKEGPMNEWEFNVGVMDVALGSGV